MNYLYMSFVRSHLWRCLLTIHACDFHFLFITLLKNTFIKGVFNKTIYMSHVNLQLKFYSSSKKFGLPLRIIKACLYVGKLLLIGRVYFNVYFFRFSLCHYYFLVAFTLSFMLKCVKIQFFFSKSVKIQYWKLIFASVFTLSESSFE